MIKRSSFLAFALLCLTFNANAQPIDIKIDADGFSNEDVLKAIDLFRSQCRPLGGEHWNDIIEIRGELSAEYAPHRLKLGWKNTLHLALRYADRPLTGPKFNEQTGVLAGHVLHYDIGAGHDPGYFASKRSSQFLCGLPVDQNGRDVFLSVPGFSFLER